MKIAYLSDEYILDTLHMLKRVEIAFVLSQVNRQFARVSAPFCHEYGAHIVEPINIEYGEEMKHHPVLRINRLLSWPFHCLKTYGVDESESFLARKHRKQFTNMPEDGWQQIDFAETAAPMNITAFDYISIKFPDPQKYHFLHPKCVQFFNAASAVFKRPEEGREYALIFQNILGNFVFGSDLFNDIFHAFSGVNDGRGFSMNCELVEQFLFIDQEEWAKKFHTSTANLLANPTVLQECYEIVLPYNFIDGSFNVEAFLGWLHKPQLKNVPSKELSMGRYERNLNLLLANIHFLNAKKQQQFSAEQISDKFLAMSNSEKFSVIKGTLVFIAEIIKMFTKSTQKCTFSIGFGQLWLPQFNVSNEFTGEKLHLRYKKYTEDFKTTFLCRHSILAENRDLMCVYDENCDKSDDQIQKYFYRILFY